MKKRFVLLMVTMACMAGCGIKEAENTSDRVDTEPETVVVGIDAYEAPTEAIDAETKEEDLSEWFVTALAEGRKAADTEDSKEQEEAELDPQTEYEKIYAPVIAEMKELLRYGYRELSTQHPLMPDFAENSVGTIGPSVSYALARLDKDNIGYAYMDINGDDIPELLIGMMEEGKASNLDFKRIFSAYTIVDGEFSRFINEVSFWRFYYKWMGNGKICHYEYQFGYEECSLAADGTGLITENGYYIDAYAENGIEFNHVGIDGEKEVLSQDEWDEAISVLDDRIENATGLPYQVFFADVQDLTGQWKIDAEQESARFQFFRDGTWMALGIKESDLKANANNVFGTCERMEDGAYQLYYQDGTELCRIETVVDANGNVSFDFDTHTFYKDEDALTAKDVLDQYADSYSSKEGISMNLYDDGTCCVWDDPKNVKLAHWGIEADEGRIRIRMQSFAEDGKCDMTAIGIFDTDSSGKAFFMIQGILGTMGEFSGKDVIQMM